jgi:hypothetical protein
MTALVEEAVSIGDLVRIFTFGQGSSTMVELTLPEDSPYAGKRVAEFPGPPTASWWGSSARTIRSRRAATTRSEAHDELLFLATPEIEDALEAMLSRASRGAPRQGMTRKDDGRNEAGARADGLCADRPLPAGRCAAGSRRFGRVRGSCHAPAPFP